jgi:hypothetical protein
MIISFIKIVTIVAMLQSSIETPLEAKGCPEFNAALIKELDINAKSFLLSNPDERCLFSLLDSLTAKICRDKNLKDIEALSAVCEVSDGIVSEQVGLLANKIFNSEPGTLIQFMIEKKTMPCIYFSLIDEISANLATYPVASRAAHINDYEKKMEVIIKRQPNSDRNLNFLKTQVIAKLDPAKYD